MIKIQKGRIIVLHGGAGGGDLMVEDAYNIIIHDNGVLQFSETLADGVNNKTNFTTLPFAIEETHR